MKRILFYSVLAAVITIGFFSRHGDSAGMPKALRIGTSSIGSSMYVLAGGAADLISRFSDMSANAESVGGSDANARALHAGKVDIAMLNNFASTNAFYGIMQFSKEGKIPLRFMIQGYPSARGIVATPGSGIKTPADLKGKKLIAKRKALREIEMLANAVLEAYGVDRADVTYIETAKTPETIAALEAGTVDAACLPGEARQPNLMKLSEMGKITFLSFEDKFDFILKKMGPAFFKYVIPAGSFKGQEKDVYWPGIRNSLVTTAGFSEEAVYQTVKAILGHYDDFKLIHSTAKYFTPENTLNDFSVPVHPGAIRYYKEIKAWTSEHEERQNRLLRLMK